MCEKKNFCHVLLTAAVGPRQRFPCQSPFQINNYIIGQVFLAYDPLEDGRTIDVIISKFFLPRFKIKEF